MYFAVETGSFCGSCFGVLGMVCAGNRFRASAVDPPVGPAWHSAASAPGALHAFLSSWLPPAPLVLRVCQTCELRT